MNPVLQKSEKQLRKNKSNSRAFKFLSSRLFKLIVSAGLLSYIFYKFESTANRSNTPPSF